MEFKDRLKTLRKEKDLTTTQLAGILNRTDSAIRAWELGRSKPDVATLIELSNYFGCSVDFVLGINNTRYRTETEKDQRINELLENEEFYFDYFAKIHELSALSPVTLFP